MFDDMEIESIKFETHLVYGDVTYKRIENKESNSFEWYVKDKLIKDDWSITALELALIYSKRNVKQIKL